jgi:sulfate permease, SulP family
MYASTHYRRPAPSDRWRDVFDRVAAERLSTPGILASPMQNVCAASLCSAVTVAFSLSFAALIFSGPLSPGLGYGIAVTFLSASVGGFVVALRGSLPFALAGPDSATSAVTASLAAALAMRLRAQGVSEHLLEPAVMVMALGSALAGIVLCGLGLGRAGRLIRFVPYPVIGGFLGATGWLIIAGAVQVVTDHSLSIANIDALTNFGTLAKIAVAGAVAVALFLGRHHTRSAFALPAILLAAIAIVHIALALRGATLTQAKLEGWMFAPGPTQALVLPWNIKDLRQFPWDALPALSGELVALIFVTAISTLLNVTGIELATRCESDLDRDLNALGVANMASAAFGGFVNCISLSRTVLNHEAGANSRLSGLIVAGVSAIMLAVGPDFLSFVPKCVLGGLLIYLGVGLLYRWLVDTSHRLSLSEYVSLLAIAVIIVIWGFIAGTLIGVLIGCATFAFSASRVNAIKFSFDGTNYRSSLDRHAGDLALLTEHGAKIQGMILQSYLFFGSANCLYQHIKALLTTQAGCRYLIFDFRLVTGLDSSASHSFHQIKQTAEARGAKLVLVNLTRELERAFRTTQFISDEITVTPDLDHALEECENSIIAAHQPQVGAGKTLHQWFSEALGSVEHSAILARACKRVEVAPGEVIARQGQSADSMHFILSGRVGVIVDMDDGRLIRVRSLGPYTTIGEMGLLCRQPRSATIKAEVTSVLYELDVEAYERIKIGTPALSHALLNYVLTIMSERISFATRVIGVLQR